MRRLLTLLGTQKHLLLAAFGLATINQSLLLVEPQFMRLLVDDYVMRVNQLDARQFFRGTLALVIAAIVVAMFARIARKYQESSSEIVALVCAGDILAELLPAR